MQIAEGFTAVPTEQLSLLRNVAVAAAQSLNSRQVLVEALTLLGEQRLRDTIWPEGSGVGVPPTMKKANDPTSQTAEETAFWQRAEDGITRKSKPGYENAYWCCAADFGKHESDCPNAAEEDRKESTGVNQGASGDSV